MEEDRRRKLAEEERRRQIAEAEDRAREEEEAREDQKRRKMEVEKRKSQKTVAARSVASSRSAQDEYNDYDDNYEQYKPSPPPQPKPSNARKPVAQKRAPPPQNSSPVVPSSGADLSLYEHAIEQDGAVERLGKLAPCRNCGRKFAVDRLEKHEKACKNITKKRKVMDPSKLRVRGTDMEQYVASSKRKPEPKVIVIINYH